MVPGRGLEPPWNYFRLLLRQVRLPISPPRHIKLLNCFARANFNKFALGRPGREFRPTVAGAFPSSIRKSLSILAMYAKQFAYFRLRPGRELNPRIEILQISALPLGYQADIIFLSYFYTKT